MLHKTKGIVLKVTHYSESSVIAQIFTEKLGLQSYLINGARKPKAKIGMSILQPLNLLELVVYHKESGGLQRISELKNDPIYHTIPYQIVKSSVVLFLNEVLVKVLRHEVIDESLFQFLFHSLTFFDHLEPFSANFHLSFLMKLTLYLGITPSFEKDKAAKFFDLAEGKYITFEPIHPHYIDLLTAKRMEELFFMDYTDKNTLSINYEIRKDLTAKILLYYHLHVNAMHELKSVEILEQVLH